MQLQKLCGGMHFVLLFTLYCFNGVTKASISQGNAFLSSKLTAPSQVHSMHAHNEMYQLSEGSKEWIFQKRSLLAGEDNEIPEEVDSQEVDRDIQKDMEPAELITNRRTTHKRWVSDMNKLLDNNVMQKKAKEKMELGSLRTEWLNVTLKRSSAISTFLDYFKIVPGPQWGVKGRDYTKCKGSVCPEFSPCSERGFSDFQVCHVPKYNDSDQPIPKPPGNCPFLGKEVVKGKEKGILNPKCTHRIDYVRHELLLGQVFILKNVYVNSRGQVFNRTHHFDRNGCGNDEPYEYLADSTRVTVFPRMVNLANWNAYAFYHGVVEMMPNFLLLSDVMQTRRRIPIAHRKGQSVFMDAVGQHIIGLSPQDLNLKEIPGDELFFVETLIQPFYQWCGRPSRSIWNDFRRRYLVPRDGLPALNPDWTTRKSAREASEKDPIPEDWVVVLGKRYHTRGLAQSDTVEAYLRKIFSSQRVVVFDGSISIMQARELFNRARLYIAVHGAAMTNMIFMPYNGFVFEMRPRAYHNSCYHYLAEVCKLEYYLTFGDGHKDSHTVVNVTEVFHVLDTIKGKMDKQLNIGRTSLQD